MNAATDAADPEAAARAKRDAHDKRVANVVARGALAGFQVHIVGDGDGGACFLVSRLNLSRTLPDVGAVEAFLKRAGARNA